ncbi:MAG: hypothetical protein H3C40_13960 [Ignavibacterium sp.]|nr:hypothetical protein [Ignavibacterium sp.]
MKAKIIFTVISSFLIFLSCSNKQKSDNQSAVKPSNDTAITVKNENTVTQDQQKYFGIECGYVKYSTYTAGQELIREWWFDDYGNKQYEENYLIINGEKSGDKTLIIDGIQYKWRLDATSGTKMKHYQTKTDYDQISQKDIERYGIKKHGFEEFMGKKCLKVSTEKPKSISWVWENIVLKSETEIAGQKVIMKAMEINSNQPAGSLFEMPADVTFE